MASNTSLYKHLNLPHCVVSKPRQQLGLLGMTCLGVELHATRNGAYLRQVAGCRMCCRIGFSESIAPSVKASCTAP